MDTSFINNLISGHIISAMDYLDFLPRFLINLVAIYVAAVKIYYKRRKNRDYLFTMYMFNLIVFIMCYLLSSNELSIGFAFGLFAIFSILRYRTEQVPIREMTYLFVAISIAVINALGNDSISITAMLSANVITLGLIYFIEKRWVQNTSVKKIQYEKIYLIKPEKYDELLEDLKLRTGLDITRVEVGDINFLNDTATIYVYFSEEEGE